MRQVFEEFIQAGKRKRKGNIVVVESDLRIRGDFQKIAYNNLLSQKLRVILFDQASTHKMALLTNMLI